MSVAVRLVVVALLFGLPLAAAAQTRTPPRLVSSPDVTLPADAEPVGEDAARPQ